MYEDLLEKVTNPPLALDSIAISANKIFITTQDSNTIEFME